MQRLSRVIVVLVGLSIITGTVVASGIPTRVYFPGGVDRRDGMSAVVDFNSRRIGVAGDMVILNKCRESDPKYCFSSDYMSFSEPAGNEKTWTTAGSRFTLKEKKGVRIGRTNVCVDVILSEQKTGSFMFYFNRDIGLVGWKLNYIDIDGQKASDEYLLAKVDGKSSKCIF